MDIFNDLCNVNKPFKRVRIRGAEVKVFNKRDTDSEDEYSSEEDFAEKETANYAEEYRKVEMEKYKQASQTHMVCK